MFKRLATQNPLHVAAATAVFTAMISLTGCDRPQNPPSAPEAGPSAAAEGATTGGNESAAKPAATATAEISGPARLADAAKHLDLATLPMLGGVEKAGERNTTSLVYRAQSTVEDAYNFHREQIGRVGWSELPGASVMPHSANATFTKAGLRVSLTVIPEQAGNVMVKIHHHGNVDFAKLPVPSGAKTVYAGPLTAIFSVEQPLADTKAALAQGLTQAGWTKYGEAGDSVWYRQNAVRLYATVSSAPAQGGKTTITFSSELLPAEIPVPENATEIEFSTSLRRLTFKAPFTQEKCFQYYSEALGREGWSTNMKEPVNEDDGAKLWAFRNANRDMMRVAMRQGAGGLLEVRADHKTGADIDEMNRKLDAQAEAFKARQREQLESHKAPAK